MNVILTVAGYFEDEEKEIDGKKESRGGKVEGVFFFVFCALTRVAGVGTGFGND